MVNDKPPLVFVHGWGANSAIWAKQAEFFKDKYDVHAYNLPGHGGKKPPAAWATLKAYGQDLSRFLEERGITGAHLVGWSLASQVVFHAAMEAKDRVRSLIYVDGTPCFVSTDGSEWGINPTKAKWFRRTMRGDFKNGLEIFVTSFVKFEKNTPLETTEWMKTAILNSMPDEKAALELLDDFHSADIRPLLGAMRVPSFAIHGGLDRIIPPGAAQFWPLSPAFVENAILAECGHAPFITAPDKFNSILAGFLESCHGQRQSPEATCVIPAPSWARREPEVEKA
jgi:pimeloyl-ACP methyl ester esterase